MTRPRSKLLTIVAVLTLSACQNPQQAAPDLSDVRVAYTQLLSSALPQDLGSLQGHTTVGAGYHSYLRFKLSDAELRKMLGKSWQTESCSELQQRIQLPTALAQTFQPSWNPMFELNSRCYERELSGHWGRADHILVIDASGYAHFHGVAQ